MKKGAIIWVAVAVLAAGGLGLVLYRKKNKPTDSGTTPLTPPENDVIDPTEPEIFSGETSSPTAKKIYAKFNDTAVRESAKVDNGLFGFGDNLIGRVPPNTLIGVATGTTTGEDGYTWFKVKLMPRKEFGGVKGASEGYVRSDVVNLK